MAHRRRRRGCVLLLSQLAAAAARASGLGDAYAQRACAHDFQQPRRSSKLRRPQVTGKNAQGQIGWRRYLLLAPYHAGVLCAFLAYRFSQALSRRGEPPHSQLAPWLHLGGWPARAADLPAAPAATALLDVTNELHTRASGVPVLLP